MHTVGIGLELRIGCEICKFLQGFLIQRQLGLLHNKAPSFNSEVAAKAGVLVHPRGRSTRQMAFGLDGIMGGKEVVGPVISQVSQGFLVQCQLAGFLFHGKAPSLRVVKRSKDYRQFLQQCPGDSVVTAKAGLKSSLSPTLSFVPAGTWFHSTRNCLA